MKQKNNYKHAQRKKKKKKKKRFHLLPAATFGLSMDPSGLIFHHNLQLIRLLFFYFFFFKKKKKKNPGECRPLFYAAIKGDWPAAKDFLKNYRHHVRTPITEEQATAFHIAAAAQHTTFITQMLKLIEKTPRVLEELKTTFGFTALHSAAQSGNVRIAEQLVKMNKELLSIQDNRGDTPLIVAAYHGHTNMVSYLFDQTGLDRLTDAKRIELLEDTIDNDMFGKPYI
jgi:hypothetical protein